MRQPNSSLAMTAPRSKELHKNLGFVLSNEFRLGSSLLLRWFRGKLHMEINNIGYLSVNPKICNSVVLNDLHGFPIFPTLKPSQVMGIGKKSDPGAIRLICWIKGSNSGFTINYHTSVGSALHASVPTMRIINSMSNGGIY